MTTTAPMEYNDSPLGFGKVIMHHVPNKNAPSLQAAMLVYAFCLGIMFLELASNIRYDWTLARRKGWTEFTKGSNRVAYFVSRIFAIVFLIISLAFMTASGMNCSHYSTAINIMCLIPLVAVDFIFMQRTVAIFGWNRFMAVFLYSLFVIDMALAISSVTWFGYGYRIPGSDFCAYVTNTSNQPHASLFIAYCVVLIFLDTLILALTCHRMLEGGLMGVPSAIRRKLGGMKGSQGSEDQSIAALLIRQGLHYYLFLEASRLAFLVVYYSVSGDTSYQVMITALLVTIGPVLAGRLFRETSDFVRRTTARSNDDQRRSGRTDEEHRRLTQQGNLLPLASPTTPITPFSFTPSSYHHGDHIDEQDDIHRPNAGLHIFVDEEKATDGGKGMERDTPAATPSTSHFESRHFFDNLPSMSPSASPVWRSSSQKRHFN